MEQQHVSPILHVQIILVITHARVTVGTKEMEEPLDVKVRFYFILFNFSLILFVFNLI